MTGIWADAAQADIPRADIPQADISQADIPQAGVQLEPIPLPETRSLQRSRQLRRKRQRRRRKGIGLLVVLAVVAGLITAVAGRSERSEPDAPEGQAPAPPVASVAAPVLVAQQDTAGRATSLTVLAPARDGKGGTLVLIPPGTMTEVIALGVEPLGLSLELGGPSRLQATVENLLGAHLGGGGAGSGVILVDDTALTNLLAPAGELTVEVPERVEEVDPAGRVRVIYEPGTTQLSPGEAERFLAVKGRSSDLARLARHQVFWEAWLAVLREHPAAIPSQPRELAEALHALVGGTVTTRVLPVEAFGTAGQGGELYRVKAEELSRLVADVFSEPTPAVAGERPRIQVLNGTGAVGLADSVRDRLGAGFDIHLTGNAASFDHAETEVVYYDRAKQAVAERVQKALGVGRLVLSRRPLGVVDVTIVVGRDFGQR